MTHCWAHWVWTPPPGDAGFCWGPLRWTATFFLLAAASAVAPIVYDLQIRRVTVDRRREWSRLSFPLGTSERPPLTLLKKKRRKLLIFQHTHTNDSSGHEDLPPDNMKRFSKPLSHMVVAAWLAILSSSSYTIMIFPETFFYVVVKVKCYVSAPLASLNIIAWK